MSNRNTGSVKKRRMLTALHMRHGGKCARCGTETGLSFYLTPQGWTLALGELELIPPRGDPRQPVRVATRYKGANGWVLLCRVCNPGDRPPKPTESQ